MARTQSAPKVPAQGPQAATAKTNMDVKQAPVKVNTPSPQQVISISLLLTFRTMKNMKRMHLLKRK